MYNLYFASADMLSECSCSIPYSVREERPTLLKGYPSQKLSFRIVLNNIYWWFVTGGRYRIWCVYDGKEIIHTSYVVPSCFKFPFLKKGEFEIGPCYTKSEYRGQGIYPSVLQRIKGGYMIIYYNNNASIRGVMKAGFIQLPGKVHRDKFGRWLYKREN